MSKRARLRGNLRAVLFLFFPSSLALVNGCTLWPQPGGLGSVVTVLAESGPTTGTNTLTNSPSEPHLKAFRVDLRCNGKSMKSQLCGAEREHWLKPITVQRALRVRRQRHACNQRKVAPETRVGVLNVQGMSWTKRSYRGMLWHIVMKMREQNADVMCLSDLSTPEWMSGGNKVVMLGLEEYALFVNGMVGIVFSRCFVNWWQNSGSVTRTAGNKRWIGLTVRIGVFRYHLLRLMIAMCSAPLLGVNACCAVYDISVAFLHSRMGEVVLVHPSQGRPAGDTWLLLATTTSDERDSQSKQTVG